MQKVIYSFSFQQMRTIQWTAYHPGDHGDLEAHRVAAAGKHAQWLWNRKLRMEVPDVKVATKAKAAMTNPAHVR